MGTNVKGDGEDGKRIRRKAACQASKNRETTKKCLHTQEAAPGSFLEETTFAKLLVCQGINKKKKATPQSPTAHTNKPRHE